MSDSKNNGSNTSHRLHTNIKLLKKSSLNSLNSIGLTKSLDIEIDNNQDNDDQINNNDTSNRINKMKTDVKEVNDIGNSWINWRKSSINSINKPSIEDITKDNKDINVTSSWSFWNNNNKTLTTSVTPKDYPQEEIIATNKILQSIPDAALFEPHEIDSSSLPSNIEFNNNDKDKVVPNFNESLPIYSTKDTIINSYNRLKHSIGLSTNDPIHLYRTNESNHHHYHHHHGIKKILIIGVHGFFPTKMIRPIIGEPTGTSLKFINEVEKSIWKWIKSCQITDEIKIQKIALEKEGKILDRVDFFYKILQNWKEEIINSDYIYIAAHSQGCPVSIILLAKLIKSFLHNNNNQKITLLAMAGINNGPFYGLIDQNFVIKAYSTFENDSLKELFSFQKLDSENSQIYLESLTILLDFNVKIIFIGSINDQLVPLYSSNCLHIRHPNIYRATFIDGNSNTPEFVTRTISIANHLHNLGLSDHGVIKEISNVLAGPLTGGGHSKIYQSSSVYDLALQFTLYTTDLPYKIPIKLKPYSIDQLGLNPYHLPWCMRGMLFEVRDNFINGNEEILKLFKEFENWNPNSKLLKDMKYRLNGLRSKL
ncbi:hypothetical protein WICMUC_002404 [Wickerhamomyces mucosus]|uniref:YMC020W-like alpha/beta hydrolase domain-containing protein n=1 Tax=Wickerhamomyces mucosus TaxID=1378264 RepID=A0A9P8PR68_9ASCO|nr:hypothetical protein WICMUC_002404 [Wickerhamomyces mucosus]